MYDDDLTIWVSDLDDWINLDFSDPYEEDRRAYEEKLRAKALEQELDQIGEIPLFVHKFISSRVLLSRGIGPSEWRWAQHEGESALGGSSSRYEIERRYVKKLIDMGRGYAIRRYARWENLTYPSALTATLPHGIRALLYQYIDTEQSLRDPSNRMVIQDALRAAFKAERLTAYDRTGIIQQALHNCARLSNGPEGHRDLDKEKTRTILALCRLHYMAQESNCSSLEDFQRLGHLYDSARHAVNNAQTEDSGISGRRIYNWKMRHLHPLMFLFPYSIRSAIARGYNQVCEDAACFSRDRAANELALAHCGMKLMRQRSIDRRKQN